MGPDRDLARSSDACVGEGGGPGSSGLGSLLVDSAGYGVGLAMLPVALLVATPILARELGSTGFGTVDVLMSIVALLVLVGVLGMDSAVGRSYFDDAPGDDRRGAIFRFGLAAASTTSLGLGILLAVAGVTVASDAAVASSLLIPVGAAFGIARLAFVLRRQRTAYVSAAALQAGVGAGCALTLVLVGLGPEGYFVGLAAGSGVGLAFALAYGGLIRVPGRRLDRNEMRLMLAYGLPLVPAAAATWAVFAIDRTLIATIRDLEEAGYYAIASKVAAPMTLAISAFAVAWGPYVFGHREAHQAEMRARALTVVVAGAGILYLPSVLFAPELVRLLGGDGFRPTTGAVPGIAIGWLGFAAATVLSTSFALSRRTAVIAVATTTAAIVNVALNLVLIPPFGFVGAAWASATSFCLLAALYWLRERRAERVPYELVRLAAIAGVLTAATVLALLTNDGEATALRVLGCLGAAALLLAFASSGRPRLGGRL